MLDVASVAGEVRSGRVEASAAVDAALRALSAQAELGAFWAVARYRAVEQARFLDARRGAGAQLGELAGVPFAVKDNFDLAGLPTSGGLIGDHRPVRSDAGAVRTLERAGAIAIGKTAMDPLGWSTHGQAEGFPECRNPIDRRLSPGGSSSGAAVAVAAGIVALGLGTDTAGSVRVPASYCGIAGLKPAWGAVPLRGCLPLGPQFDTVGVLAASIRGCAAACQVLTGGPAVPPIAPRRVGVLVNFMRQSEPEVVRVCESALERLKAGGVALEEVELEFDQRSFGLALAVDIARTWGDYVREDPGTFPAAMAVAVKRAAQVGEARFEDALAALQADRRRLAHQFESLDAVVCPTVPTSVPELEEETVAVSTRFTRSFNALGWPAASVLGGVDSRGRPVGVQVAAPGDLGAVIETGARLELPPTPGTR
jgi:aspartyl-tRNA(Asn)/glutamyl-tRNA(Gln) amidotransferase subunit A